MEEINNSSKQEWNGELWVSDFEEWKEKHDFENNIIKELTRWILFTL